MTRPVQPSRRRQADRRNEAERRLLVAAAELIGEVGPMKTTLSGIGERAGYSRGLATHHFGSKSALVQRIMDTVTTEFHEKLEQHRTSDTAVGSIREIVIDYVDGLAEMSPLVRARIALWADSAASGTPEQRSNTTAADQRFRDGIIHCLQEGMSTGELPGNIDVEGFTTVLVGMLRGIALQYLLNGELDLDASRTEALAFVDARLKPDPS